MPKKSLGWDPGKVLPGGARASPQRYSRTTVPRLLLQPTGDMQCQHKCQRSLTHVCFHILISPSPITTLGYTPAMTQDTYKLQGTSGPLKDGWTVKFLDFSEELHLQVRWMGIKLWCFIWSGISTSKSLIPLGPEGKIRFQVIIRWFPDSGSAKVKTHHVIFTIT